jgi:8-oxo-dGTP pyrophosphatase MutT (NUDIX family)
MISRESLVTAISNYVTPYPEEAAFVPRFLDLLSQPGCFQRDHLPGHITGSAWIVNEPVTKVLMVLHGSLGRWLQPGGHADGEENVLNTARREAFEETGLSNLTLVSKQFIDLDIHPIPQKEHFPGHDHYDIRFLFLGDEKHELRISDESTDLRWIELGQLDKFTTERSVLRLREKAILSLEAAGRKTQPRSR